MPAHPRLEVIASSEPDSAEPVSPELVLVDPELAARARARLALPTPPPRPRLAPVAEDTRVEVVDRLSGSAQLAAFGETRSRIDGRADVEPSAEPPARPARPAPPPAVVALSREPQPAKPIPPRPVAPAQRSEPTVEASALRPAPAPRPAAPVPFVESDSPQPIPAALPSTAVAAPVSAPAPLERRRRRWPRRLRILLVGLAAAVCVAFAVQVIVDVWFTTSPDAPSVARIVPPVAGEDAAADDTPVAKDPAPPPIRGAKTKSPVTSPAFVWIAVPGASRYEVVFERNGKIVYRATTTRTRLELPRSWRYAGNTHRLERGRYHWTVWPLVDGKRGRAIVSSDYEL